MQRPDLTRYQGFQQTLPFFNLTLFGRRELTADGPTHAALALAGPDGS